jgi:hypothetical protein
VEQQVHQAKVLQVEQELELVHLDHTQVAVAVELLLWEVMLLLVFLVLVAMVEQLLYLAHQ